MDQAVARGKHGVVTQLVASAPCLHAELVREPGWRRLWQEHSPMGAPGNADYGELT